MIILTVYLLPLGIINNNNSLYYLHMKHFVGYSKAPEQLQSSTRHICQSPNMKSMGCEPATIRTVDIGAHCTTYYVTGEDSMNVSAIAE